MIVSRFKSLGAASVLLVAATVVAFAQSAPPVAAPGSVTGESGVRGGMAACRADIQALCSSVAAGKGAKLSCLVENRTKASPECQAAMSTLKQRGDRKALKAERRARAQACATDVATFCAGAKGQGRVECLKANEAKLSATCVQAREQAKEGRRVATKQARQACQADAAALCGAAGNGRGAQMQCLRANEAKVSPGCGQALASLPMRKRDRKAAGSPLAPKPQ